MTVSVVPLPNDEMKGRIIGREGRNIRALEAATGVNILIDDTPEAVVISCFDPIRKEIARRLLEKLISDGRIHPTRIEELIKKIRKEIDEEVFDAGEKAVLDCGVQGVPKQIITLLGRLQFRFSFSQNVLKHSIETAAKTFQIQLCRFASGAGARGAESIAGIGKDRINRGSFHFFMVRCNRIDDVFGFIVLAENVRADCGMGAFDFMVDGFADGSKKR